MRRLTGGLALCLLLTVSLARAQEHEADGPGAPVGATTYPSLHIIGFSDIDFAATDEPDPASNSRFFEGQLVLHLTSALSERFTFVGELSFTARPEAAFSAAATGFTVEVERTILKYTHSDALKLSAGRFHTPISYWNVAYHHGQWLQTTASRPEMVQFGGQFLPVHFVGAFVEGALPGSLNFNYGFGVGNGRSAVISRAGDAVDVNNNRALAGVLFLKPGSPPDLQIGGAVYADKITLEDASNHRELILNAHFAWTRENPELIAEYVWVRHEDIATGLDSESWGYYAQAAWRLPGRAAKWKPYGRWEEMRVAAADPVFASLRDRKTLTSGLRFDASDLVALKAEYRRQRSAGADWVNAAFAQVAFSF